ncbi:MAG: PAS domain S-box protein, partial [Flavobacteriales bacterium]
MGNINQLKLQLIINKLLELDLKHDDVSVILKKALNIILKSPLTSSFLNKGIIMLAEDNSKTLKLVAHKNVGKETLINCKNVVFGECVCGIAAITKKIQYSNIGVYKEKSKEKGYGHYSLPILYNNNLLGVITLYLLPNHKKSENEITFLKTITNTLALILYKKKDVKYLNFIKNKLDRSFGTTYFRLIAKFLSKELGMKYCLIGQYNKESDIVKTVVLFREQKVQKNITYNLAHTPCLTVIKKDTCIYPSQTQQLFPNDKDLVTFGVESYIGILVRDECKQPIGLLVLMHDKPFDKKDKNIEAIKFFLPRLASELARKNYEDKLILNELKYRDVFDKFQDVFVRATLLSNGESIISEVSPSIYKFSGYKPSELVGRPSSYFYRDVKQREEMMKILMRDKQIKDYPLTFEKKNGENIYTKVTSQLIFEDNNPVEIRVVPRDVTDIRNDVIRKDISYLIAKKTQRRITNIYSLSEFIHNILGNIIDNSNFSIALINRHENKIEFPIYFDEKIKNKVQFSKPYENGLIEYIIKNKNQFIKNKTELEELIKTNRIDYKGPLPKIIISFPLKSEGLLVGVLTVKSYKKENQFTNDDICLLDFIATQLSSIIEKDEWQNNLIKKERYFRSLVESSLEVTGILDVEGKITYISESVKTILGYSAHHIIGQSFYDFIPNRYSKQAIEQFNYIKKTKWFKAPFLVKTITAKGTERTIQYSLNNQLKNKEIRGIIFNAQDITEKYISQKQLKKSQEELFSEQENYRTIFNYANDGIIRIDRDYRIIETNKRMISILGYSKKELLSKSIMDLTLKHEVPLIKREMRKLSSKKRSSVSFEKRSIHKNGKSVICKIFVKTVLDDNNNIDYYIAFITDITKRVEAVKRATDMERALELSANVLFANTKGIIINVGKKVASNSGYSVNELIGKNTRIFNSGHHSKEFFKQMWTTIKSGKTWSGEVRNKKKDGSFYWLYTTIIPIIGMENKVEYY